MVNNDKKQLEQQLVSQQNGYTQLKQGAGTLLATNLYWTERLLLRLTHRVATIRLKQLTEIRPDDH